MADAPATFASLSAIMKRVYGPRVEEQLNQAPFLYNLFDEDPVADFMGEGWFFPAHVSYGAAVGAYAESDEVADSAVETYALSRIDSKQNYGTIRFSGKSVAASRTNMQAFLRSKASEIEAKTKSLMSDMNRQCYGDSFGTMGIVLSDAANTITFGPEVNMLWFPINKKIDIFASDRTTKRNTAGIKQGRAVTAVNRSTRTITYGGADLSAGIVATDIVFAEDQRFGLATAAEGKEINGLRFLLDDGTDSLATCQNIDRSVAANAAWKSVRLFNAGVARPLALDLIQSLVDEINIASGEKPDILLGGLGQQRNYLNLLWYEVRYQPQQLKGGFQTLQYNDMDFMIDKDMLPATLVALKKSRIRKYELQKLGLLDFAGVTAERIPKQDNYEMLIAMYGNLGITRPGAGGRLGDLIEP